MALSAKHFNQTATNIKAVVDEAYASYEAGSVALWAAMAVLKDVANQMASSFARENPRFDRQRFLAACGF